MINSKLVENIQLLFYKEHPSLLEKLNLDDDKTFLEPLLFAYFNSKKNNSFPKEVLEELMQGYFTKKEPLKIEHSYNRNGIVYIPKIGYFEKTGNKVQNCYIVKDTSIELIYKPLVLLEKVFELASSGNTTNEIVMNDSLFDRFVISIESALDLIKKSSPQHFTLIEENCKKIVLFKTDPKITNSFATINAHGMAFLNVYQENYDEIFFIDDIAHQTGHIILTAILFERKKYFLIDENQNISTFTKNKSDYRNFYILLHALYTYYTTFLCLDACLNNNCFNKRQTHEAKARIGFYLLKCKMDLINFEKIINCHNGLQNVLSIEGIEIFQNIKKKYFEILNIYEKEVSNYKYKNQPYNFTYSEFVKLNPFKND